MLLKYGLKIHFNFDEPFYVEEQRNDEDFDKDFGDDSNEDYDQDSDKSRREIHEPLAKKKNKKFAAVRLNECWWHRRQIRRKQIGRRYYTDTGADHKTSKNALILNGAITRGYQSSFSVISLR